MVLSCSSQNFTQGIAFEFQAPMRELHGIVFFEKVPTLKTKLFQRDEKLCMRRKGSLNEKGLGIKGLPLRDSVDAKVAGLPSYFFIEETEF